jgi:hypothetical protein
VSEVQIARSALLADLACLEGEASLPLDAAAFRAWLDFVDGNLSASDLRLHPETARTLFEVRPSRARKARRRVVELGTAAFPACLSIAAVE